VLAALLGIAGAGQALVVLIGGIDLPIAAWIVAGATMTVQLTGSQHWRFWTVLRPGQRDTQDP
jgi:ribose transport system permease protein